MNEDFEVKQQKNLESIEQLRREKPFKNAVINKFYDTHLGDGPNCFIHTRYYLRDYHDAIYHLLLFLDQHGNLDLYVDFKQGITFKEPDTNKHRIKLRDHILGVTQNVVRSLTDRDEKGSNHKLFLGGISALTYNIGLTLGQEYMEHYSNNVCQGSLAVLENIPYVTRQRNFNNIREIVKLYHLYMNNSMDYVRGRLEENRRNYWGIEIMKLLIDAEMQQRRKEVFRYTVENPENPWFGNNAKQKAQNEANRNSALSEKDREQLNINLEEEFKRKQEAYVGEFKGLNNKVKLKDKIILALDKIIGIQKKYIKALKENKTEDADRAKEELVKAKVELQNLKKNPPNDAS